MAAKRPRPHWPARRHIPDNPFRIDAAQHFLTHEYHVATQKIVVAISMQTRITVDLTGITLAHMPALEYMLGALYGIFSREQIQAWVVIANADPQVRTELAHRLGEIRELYRAGSTQPYTLASASLNRSLYWDRPMIETEAQATRAIAGHLGISSLLAWTRLDFSSG